MEITTRQRAILELILDAEGYITLGSIADSLGLSTRTVQRDLGAFPKRLGGFSKLIEKKSANGVRFCGDAKQRQSLRRHIADHTELRPSYSQNERMTGILYTLLTDSEPHKIYSLSKDFGVTEATISADLDKCEKWFNGNKLELVRKPGVGIYVDADEWQRRRALMGLYYGCMEESGSADHAFRQPASSLGALFETDLLDAVKLALEETDREEELILNDRSRTALMIHLYLIVRRVRDGASITAPIPNVSNDDGARQLAGRLVKKLEQYCGTPIPEGETKYLTAILMAAQGLRGFGSERSILKAKNIADKIIRIAEAKTGLIIEPDSGFYNALVNHLVPTIERLNMNMQIRNPMLKEIQTHYGSLYELAKTCAAVIEDELMLPVPDAEIGYIAIHLGVALEDSRSSYIRRCRAVVCCPSGIVTAQLLALRVNREFPDIEIVNSISTSNVDFERLLENGVEMIISTVPIENSSIPCAVVSPFLNDSEKDNVWKILKVCKTEPPKERTYVKLSNLAASLTETKAYIDAILQILGTLFVWRDDDCTTVAELVQKVAPHMTSAPEQKSLLANDLFAREQYGSTVTENNRTMLLHCRSAAVDRLWLGIVTPRCFIHSHNMQEIRLKTILVMVAPKDCPRQSLEAISAISRAVVEEGWFIGALRAGDKVDCYAAVEKILTAFYHSITKR